MSLAHQVPVSAKFALNVGLEQAGAVVQCVLLVDILTLVAPLIVDANGKFAGHVAMRCSEVTFRFNLVYLLAIWRMVLPASLVVENTTESLSSTPL